MSEIYPEQVPADGTTPGRAAYEAWWRTAEGVPASPDVTYDQDAGAWDAGAWDAAAQAAIDCAIAASAKRVAEHGWTPPKPAPELAAAMAETRQLREQLASETRTRLHLAGERDEARSDLTQLRALAAEILAAFEPSGSGHSGHTARIGQVQHAKWAKRLGAFGEVRAETDSQP